VALSISPEPLPVIWATDPGPVAPAEPADEEPVAAADDPLEVAGASLVEVPVVELEPQATSNTAARPATAPPTRRRRKDIGDMTFPSGCSAVVEW
jgi:hypothetical protein